MQYQSFQECSYKNCTQNAIQGENFCSRKCESYYLRESNKPVSRVQTRGMVRRRQRIVLESLGSEWLTTKQVLGLVRPSGLVSTYHQVLLDLKYWQGKEYVEAKQEKNPHTGFNSWYWRLIQ